jgi:signal transduction histidine kinase
MPVVILLNVALILLLLAAVGIIICRVVYTRHIPVSICLFLILPAGQLLTLRSFSFSGWSLFWIFGLLFGMGANILFLFYAILHEKRVAAQKELLDAKHSMALEQSHFEAVEQRRAELENIRRDFNDRLNAVAALVNSGDDVRASESISALAEKISATRENPYCTIPVINAVLTQKEKECGDAGIMLSVDLSLPASLTVSPMHLCSIFSNILDNSIAASKNITGKPKIMLSSIMDGDYLFIKATNPAAAPPEVHAPGHGYGQRIITELATQYDGYFRASYNNGIYTAIVSLTAVSR